MTFFRLKAKGFSFKFLKIFFGSLLLSFSHFGYALVDMRNANYLETWKDIDLDGVGFKLKIVRAYNSRCLENGPFGYGWCSELESYVKVTAEGGLKLTECGCGLEFYYNQKEHDVKSVEKTINKIMNIVRKRNKDFKPDDFIKLRKEIERDKTLREEFVKQLGLEGEIQTGVSYFSNRGGNDKMVLKSGGYYLRSLPDGSFQRYNAKTGKLIGVYDRNQNFIKISYKNIGKEKVISHILDNNGRKLTFSYKGDKVSKIQGPGNLVSQYKHKEEDLVWVKDSKGEVFIYFYDDLHNMTKIVFPDKTSKEIFYNKEKDWVIGFKNRKGCKEDYTYQADPKNPLNRYSSKVVKKCNGKIVNQSQYHFVHRKYKNRPGRYLHKAEINNNGFVVRTIYHPKFGKPSFVVRGKEKMRYKYYSNGFLKEKKTQDSLMRFSYNNACRKVSSMKAHYFESAFNRGKASLSLKKSKSKKAGKKKTNKVVKVVKTDMFYDEKRCNLVLVKNSEGQEIKVRHDQKGRVSFLKDQADREVRIQYNDILDKPSLIHRPGIGKIEIHYKPDGGIDKIESQKGPVVAAQVANVLSHLMDVITPIASHIVL